MTRLNSFRSYSISAALLVLSVFIAAEEPSLAADPKTAAAPPASNSLTYRSPQGVEFQVTADGLSSIRFAGRQLASGGWSVFNAEPWFKNAGSGRVDTKALREKSIKILGEKQARVRQVKGDVVSTTDYTFDGEDVLISARVENNHPDEPLNVVGFSGLAFHFQRPPTGLMMVQHISYFQYNGLKLCHPGEWSKIGGSYAEDDAVGVGLSPWKTGLTRTLFLWDYADWNPDKRERLPERRLIYFVVAPIPEPGGRHDRG